MFKSNVKWQSEAVPNAETNHQEVPLDPPWVVLLNDHLCFALPLIIELVQFLLCLDRVSGEGTNALTSFFKRSTWSLLDTTVEEASKG